MEIAYKDALKAPLVPPRCSVTALNRLETRNWDLIAAIPHCWDSRALEVLRDQLREMTGRTHIFLAPSARCAIAQVLSALPQTEVVMPAWTCPDVRTAVDLAGKDITYVDIDGASLNATSLQYADVARIGQVLLPTHAFGIPTDIKRICDLARERDCITIEDAAAAFPARIGNRLLGTYGDVGIISFERSKRVPSFRGAAIIVNNDKSIDITKLDTPFVPTTRPLPVREALFSVIHNLATVPWVYGRFAMPQALRRYSTNPLAEIPSPSLAATSPSYVVALHPYQAALATRVLKRIDKIRDHISSLVTVYQQTLKGTGIQTFVPAGCDKAGLLRFPIAFPGRNRSEVLRSALGRGLFLETNYEEPLPDATQHEAFPSALWAAQNLIFLPLYASLSVSAAERLALRLIDIHQETTPIPHEDVLSLPERE